MDITLRVMGPWTPFCYYIFLTLETKCGFSFIEVGPQTQVIENLQRDIAPRVRNLWPLFLYTQYIQSLSMFIRTFSFLAFIVPEKSVTKIFKNGKIGKPVKGHISKSYGPMATSLPLHLHYLRDQVWYKFHRCRTTNIKVIEQNAFYFFENLPRDITPRVMNPWPLFQYTLYIQSLSMFIPTLSFLAFIVPEKSVTKIFKNGKI